MDRFLKQFSLGDGYYGQNYIWKKGVDDRLFTRGHGWVLEGLLSCIRATGEENYKKEAKKLIENLMEIQKPDGSFSYLMGYGRPKKEELEGSGICEKTCRGKGIGLVRVTYVERSGSGIWRNLERQPVFRDHRTALPESSYRLCQCLLYFGKAAGEPLIPTGTTAAAPLQQESPKGLTPTRR